MIVMHRLTIGNRMDRLGAMEVFVNVVDSHGFTAAAERLGLSRAAVSKQVLQLEETLGARLLNRTTRRVSVTELGRMYYDRCRRVLAEVESADLLVEQLHSRPTGTLKVSAPMSFGMSHLGTAVADFLRVYPDLTVSLTLNDRFTDLVEEGYDVAIRISRIADSSLVAKRIAPVPCLMVATPEYLETQGRPARPSDLRDHPCLTYSYLHTGQDWTMSGADGRHSVRVSGPLQANNGEVLLQGVRSGLGITFLPGFLVRADIAAGRLVHVLPDYFLPELTVFAVSPPNRYPATKVRVFIEFLTDRYLETVL